MPFPLAKLGYMAIRQMAKPIAAAIKRKATTTPFLRNYILMPPAQLYHKFDINFRMKILGLGKVKAVQPLTEESAIELAADMLGEFVIFTVGAGCIYWEYRRQVRKDQNKEEEQNTRLIDLEKTVQELGVQVEIQDAHIRELNRILASQPTPAKIKDPRTGTVLEVVR